MPTSLPAPPGMPVPLGMSVPPGVVSMMHAMFLPPMAAVVFPIIVIVRQAEGRHAERKRTRGE